MNKSFYLLLMLVILKSVSFAESWNFRSVDSYYGGYESFLDSKKYITNQPHSGTVTVTLTVLGTSLRNHRVRFRENINTASWIYINDVYSVAIVSAGNIVAGWDYDYVLEAEPGKDYIVQVTYNGFLEDWLIVDAKNPVANITVMAEGGERGEMVGEVVRAYCPANSQILSGYCKIWDDTELTLDASPDVGTMGTNYYECRNPYSIGEDRYTRAYAECF